MSSSTELERQQALFARCLDHPPGEWEQVLVEHCDDPDLRERVRQLLRHHSDTPTHDSGFLQLVGGDPERIGPYHVTRRLGEGGMGIVYVAEQHEPVRRQVAVKVLRGGYSSREVLARFDAERQALALMSHANIARIYDAGTTADHRPYIVMEYVPGEHITHYCEQRRLPLRTRLAIFLTVCEAVHHAHQKGVIHRDLKPSNILVMEEDGRPVPKIIDFGIAKAVTQRLTDRTLETQVGSLLGTPDYMSPEQAELSPLDVDTRADVFALGAVLYQLLTGATPLDLAASGKTLMEMQRLIKEQVPPPPSQRVAGSLRRAIRGELDWITCKALEKERVHRYASAADLARDIRAHLHDETVLAGPPSRLRKAHKFVRRHWLASSLLVLLAVVVTFSQIMLVQKNRELLAERDRANRKAEIAQHVTQFTGNLFRLANPGVAGAPDISARDLLDIGVRSLEQEAATQDEEVQAALLEAVVNAYLGLGVLDRAENYLNDVLEWQEISGSRNDYARTLLLLMRLRTTQGDLEAAEAVGRKVIDLLQGHDGSDKALLLSAHTETADILRRAGRPDEAAAMMESVLTADVHSKTDLSDEEARALLVLGRIRGMSGQFDEAEQLLSRLLDLQLHDNDSMETLEIKNSLATMLVDRGEAGRAAPLLRDTVAISRAIFGEDHWHAGIMYNQLGYALSDLPEHFAEAEDAYLKAREIIRARLGDTHPEMATVQNNLGSMYISVQRWQEAEAALRDAIAIRMNTIGDHPYTANTIVSHGFVLSKMGKVHEAEAIIRDGLAMYTRTLGDSNWRTSNARMALASVLMAQERFDEAEAVFNEAHSGLSATLGENHWRTERAAERLEELAKARAAAAR